MLTGVDVTGAPVMIVGVEDGLKVTGETELGEEVS
jgi:hypothetical protein